jgi:hypothetical protein
MVRLVGSLEGRKANSVAFDAPVGFYTLAEFI